MAGYVVGVDLGATRIRAVVADEDGRFISRAEEPTATREEHIEAQLVGLVRTVLSRSGVDRPNSIGVGSVGPLDIRSGTVVKPPNLPVKRIEVARTLCHAIGARVLVLNDCTAACYGEAVFGAGKGVSDMAFISIGTGIGGGAMVDGHLLLGKSGNAVEVGHLVVDASGRLRCGCGSYGHWEAYCSGAGMPAFLREWAAGRGVSERELSGLLGRAPSAITVKDVLDACRRGEHLLASFLDELVRLNAAGLASVINAFNPSLIFMGGSVALAGFDLLIQPAIRFLSAYAYNEIPDIIKSPLGHDAVLYGAIALALNPPEGLAGKMHLT